MRDLKRWAADWPEPPRSSRQPPRLARQAPEATTDSVQLSASGLIPHQSPPATIHHGRPHRYHPLWCDTRTGRI